MQIRAIIGWVIVAASAALVIDGCSQGSVPGQSAEAKVTAVRFSAPTVMKVPDFPLVRGVSMVDFDDDGRDDLTVVTPDGVTFLRSTAAGFERHDHALAGADGLIWADADDDGAIDLLVLRQSELKKKPIGRAPALLRRLADGSWEDWTEAAGLSETRGDWEGGQFGDLDGDGDLDLALSGGVIETTLADRKGDRHWGTDGQHGNRQGRHGYRGSPNRLLFNDGSGVFEDRSTEVGCIGPPDGEEFAVGLWDYDLDGDLDVMWTNDFRSETLCQNDGNGTFIDVSQEALGIQGATGAMGLTMGDLDGDACLELYATNLGRDLIYSPTGGPRIDIAYTALMNAESDTSQARSSWGVSLFDADLDGDLDVATASAWLPLEGSGGIPGGLSFYYNRLTEAGTTLTDQGWAVNDVFTKTVNAFGLATGDVDGDNRIDLALGLDPTLDPNAAGPGGVKLLMNRSPLAGATSLSITLRKPAPNTRAVGAVVVVSVAGRRTAQVLSAGGSFLSAHSQTLRFGLAGRAQADWVAIQWPGVGWEIRTGVAAGAHTFQPTGSACFPTGTCAGIVPVGPCIEYPAGSLEPQKCAAFCSHLDECGWLTQMDMDDAAQCQIKCETHRLVRDRAECTIATECSDDFMARCWE